MSRGDAVIFRVTGDACECVPATLFVVFFQEKPKNQHQDRCLVLLNISQHNMAFVMCDSSTASLHDKNK